MITRALEQMRAHRVDAIVAGQPLISVERLQQIEPGARPVHHPRGDGVIERDHRVVRHPLQQAIERQDLRPVGVVGRLGFVMHRRDRRL